MKTREESAPGIYLLGFGTVTSNRKSKITMA